MLHAPRSRWDLYAFCVWLALVPLPFGSNRSWALALTLPLLLALAAVVAWRERARFERSLPAFLARPYGLLLAAFVALLVLQIAPIGADTISVAPQKTAAYALVAVGCLVAFWLVTVLVRSDQDLKILLYALVACGVLQAVLAVVLYTTKSPVLILDVAARSDLSVTGTFLNRNLLAGYLNLALAAGIGLLMGRLAPAREARPWRLVARDWLQLLLSDKARLRLVLVLLVIALILTRSRMGNAAFFIALLASATIYAYFAGTTRRGLMILVASFVVIDLALIGAWVGVDRVVERVQNTPLLADSAQMQASQQAAAAPQRGGKRQEQSVEDRIRPAWEAIGLVRDHPWFGMGGGTFYVTFMAYKGNNLDYYNHAHNDYLQIASDTGLVGLGLLTALALYAFVASLRILRHRSNEYVRGAAFAAIMAIIYMALHAIVDFNLQIPSHAITFSVLIALPFAAQALASKRSKAQSPAERFVEDLVGAAR